MIVTTAALLIDTETKEKIACLGPRNAYFSFLTAAKILCEESTSRTNSNSIVRQQHTAPYPSWFRQTLVRLHLASLPLPRIVIPNDPDLTLSGRHIRERQHDELELRKLQGAIQEAVQQGGDRQRIGALLQQSYNILYGSNLLPQHRQDFLQQYGCTAWTEPVLLELLELGASRGLVEIGAGHGQWARVLNDRFQELRASTTQGKKKKFDFCLAFDNKSALPLDPTVYHRYTQPYHDYFYDQVQPCASIAAVLQQWPCRGRILLLVYPSPNDPMAVDAMRAYAAVSPLNDTVVYVGEGRGGANADDDFFDYLESGEWILCKILPVQSFGGKGFEKLYIFKRRAQTEVPAN